MTHPAKVIAFLGKGGTGKTVLSCLAGRLLAAGGRRTLLVDADPAQGLTSAVGVAAGSVRSIGEVRDRVIAAARAEGRPDSPEALALTVDYLLLEALAEVRGMGLLAMGSSQDPGCYCAVNRLLRDSLDHLAGSFDRVVVDAEAGFEQVSRRVTRRVDRLFIVTDRSRRGVDTALAIARALARLQEPPPAGVLFNRAAEPDAPLVEALAAAGLPCLGAVPDDETVARFDREGRSLLDLPAGSVALEALARILSA